MTSLLRTIAVLVALLPLPLANGLGRALGWFYGTIIRYHRADALDAIAKSLPDKSARERKQIVDAAYQNFGLMVIEYMRIIGGRADDVYGLVDMAEEDLNRCRELLNQGKGVIMLAGHTGNWELLTYLPYRLGILGTVIVKPLKPKGLNDLIVKIRKRYGIDGIDRKEAYRESLKRLKQNNMLGIVIDQNVIASEGIFVDFFGRPACTSPALAYLAAQSGAPVLPVFIRRENGRHRITLGDLMEPLPDRKPATIQAATQAYTKVLEDFIREHPEQWTWIHRRWRTKPSQDNPNEEGEKGSKETGLA